MRKSEKQHMINNFNQSSLNKVNPNVTEKIEEKKALLEINNLNEDPDLVLLNGHDQSILLGKVFKYSVYASYAESDVIRAMSNDTPDKMKPHILVIDSEGHMVRDEVTRTNVTNELIRVVGSDHLDDKMSKLYKVVIMNGTVGASGKSMVNSYNERQRSAMNEKESN